MSLPPGEKFLDILLFVFVLPI